jgi:hypothetical protein
MKEANNNKKKRINKKIGAAAGSKEYDRDV